MHLHFLQGQELGDRSQKTECPCGKRSPIRGSDLGLRTFSLTLVTLPDCFRILLGISRHTAFWPRQSNPEFSVLRPFAHTQFSVQKASKIPSKAIGRAYLFSVPDELFHPGKVKLPPARNARWGNFRVPRARSKLAYW